MAPKNEGGSLKIFRLWKKWKNWPNLFIGGSFFRLWRGSNPANLKVGWGKNQFFFFSGNMVQWGQRGGGKNTSLDREKESCERWIGCFDWGQEMPGGIRRIFLKNVPHSRHHSVYLNFIKSLVSKKTTPLNFHDIKKSRLTQTYLKLYDRFLGNWRELRINSFFLQDGLFNWSQG